jgi:hypothetical protein
VTPPSHPHDPITYIDGTLVFQRRSDLAREHAAALRLDSAFTCRFHKFGALCPIEWFVERHGRLIGLAEYKWRPFPSTQYPTAYIALSKWYHLTFAAISHNVPAIHVWEYTDGLLWVPLKQVDARRHTLCQDRAREDELIPVIEVPIPDLRPLPKR